MELIIAFLTTLMAIVSPVGAAVDQLAEDALRDQVAAAEELHVRIDNVPTYQILNGRVEHLRIAGRGIFPRQFPDLRVEAIDLETDVVDVDFGALRQGTLKLDEPVQAALKLELTAEDVNRFLQSAMVQSWLDDLKFTLPGPGGAREQNRYGLGNPTLNLLPTNRLQLVVDLQDRIEQEDIPITIELGLQFSNGHQLKLIDPVITIDRESAPPELLTSLVAGAEEQLTLRVLEESGIIARILTFDIRENELELAIFARVEPTSPFLASGVTARGGKRVLIEAAMLENGVPASALFPAGNQKTHGLHGRGQVE